MIVIDPGGGADLLDEMAACRSSSLPAKRTFKATSRPVVRLRAR